PALCEIARCAWRRGRPAPPAGDDRWGAATARRRRVAAAKKPAAVQAFHLGANAVAIRRNLDIEPATLREAPPLAQPKRHRESPTRAKKPGSTSRRKRCGALPPAECARLPPGAATTL